MNEQGRHNSANPSRAKITNGPQKHPSKICSGKTSLDAQGTACIQIPEDEELTQLCTCTWGRVLPVCYASGCGARAVARRPEWAFSRKVDNACNIQRISSCSLWCLSNTRVVVYGDQVVGIIYGEGSTCLRWRREASRYREPEKRNGYHPRPSCSDFFVLWLHDSRMAHASPWRLSFHVLLRLQQFTHMTQLQHISRKCSPTCIDWLSFRFGSKREQEQTSYRQMVRFRCIYAHNIGRFPTLHVRNKQQWNARG